MHILCLEQDPKSVKGSTKMCLGIMIHLFWGKRCRRPRANKEKKKKEAVCIAWNKDPLFFFGGPFCLSTKVLQRKLVHRKNHISKLLFYFPIVFLLSWRMPPKHRDGISDSAKKKQSTEKFPNLEASTTHLSCPCVSSRRGVASRRDTMVFASFVEEENTTTCVSVCPDMYGGPSNKENLSRAKLPPSPQSLCFQKKGWGVGGKG